MRVVIEDIAEHSKKVQQGGLFVAHRGNHYSGVNFVEQAIENGAVVVVTEDEQLFESWHGDTTLVWVPNSRSFVAYASHRIFGEPSQVLPIIAVTGTNGKTTVTHFIGQIANQLGIRAMVIGTNGVFIDGVKQAEDEGLTTKSAVTLHRLLNQAIQRGVELVALEASSMGLEMHRLDYCEIDVGVFLNLSQEHIEDHRSIENYKLAKKRLVSLSEQLVCNADDAFCHGVAVKCNKPVMLYSCKGQGDLMCHVLHEDAQHSLVKLSLGQLQEVCSLPFSGGFLQSNMCAAISALALLGLDVSQLVSVLSTLRLPAGRMQLVRTPNGARVYIDYAHTPAAFLHVLQHITKHCKGRLIVVFSCGGERDQAKRQEMGRVASKYAQTIILTTDNSRSEDPKAINAQIRSGFFALQQQEELLDRKEAIARALELAQADDVVLVAGKGHENQQLVGHTSMPFNDYEVTLQLLADFDDVK